MGARGRGPARYAAALFAPHGGDGVARDRPPADIRAAPARPPLDNDDRGALRPPRDIVYARGGGANRGADRGGWRPSRGVMIAFGNALITLIPYDVYFTALAEEWVMSLGDD